MRRTILIVLSILMTILTYGQDAAKNKRSEEVFLKFQNSIASSKIGKQFLFDTTFTSLENTNINFTNLKGNSFVYFGMSGCHPCMQELPALIELAGEHAEISFIYATHDNRKTIELEQKHILGDGFKLPENFLILTIDRAFIDKHKLIVGYPTRYFLDKKGIVKFFNFGGKVLEKDVKAEKKIMLASIIDSNQKREPYPWEDTVYRKRPASVNRNYDFQIYHRPISDELGIAGGLLDEPAVKADTLIQTR